MKDTVFQDGEFAVYKGVTYLAKSYLKEYELFHLKDIAKKNPLLSIPKEQADDYYYYLVFCDIKGVRYKAVEVKNGYCLYRPYPSYEYCFSERVENCNEIWIRKTRSSGTEIETLWFRPYCMEHPSKKRFYVELMANMNVMTGYYSKSMSLQETIKNLVTLYGERIEISDILQDTYPIFFGKDYLQEFKIDGIEFNLTYDFWDIICISPKSKDGNPYIYKIVKYFNSLKL